MFEKYFFFKTTKRVFLTSFKHFYLQVFCWDFFCRKLISQVFHPAAFGITVFCWPPVVSIQGYAVIRGWDFYCLNNMSAETW